MLALEGLRLEYQVVNLREIPKDLFLHSNVPEDVVLAILGDFGAEQPEKVIRQILQHLLKLIGRVPRLKKYQYQLHTLSRLRKLEAETKKEILTMPIHYEIETDALYIEGKEIGIEIGKEQGFEKGIEQGIEKGLKQAKYDLVMRLLRQGQLTKETIASVAEVDMEFVLQVERELQGGKN